MKEITPDLLQIFKDAAAIRRERGIELMRWSIMIPTFSPIPELWDEWKSYLGTEKSEILLEHLMLRQVEWLREIKRRQDARKANGAG